MLPIVFIWVSLDWSADPMTTLWLVVMVVNFYEFIGLFGEDIVAQYLSCPDGLFDSGEKGFYLLELLFVASQMVRPVKSLVLVGRGNVILFLDDSTRC